MDIPKPPDDLELKNIIDKLANFVARNGPEFEQMTKQKQKDNPKFSFLFAGEHFNYYQYRVTTEQAILKQQQQKMAHQQAMIQQTITQQSLRTAPWQQSAVTPGSGPGLLPPAQSALQEQIEQQRQAAIEQIKQSETNLAAQYQSIMQQQQVMIDDAITKAKKEQLMALSSECEMSLEEMDEIVQPIIESCTKDAISNGKNWIFTRNTSQRHGDLIAHYLLDRITAKEAPFEQRLHLIYLVNDILHHCLRRNAEELRKSIESVVVPLFCIAQLAADEDRQTKLTKAMKNPLSAVANYQASLAASHATIVTNISQEMNTRYLALQKQHQEYAAHLNGQIAALEHQLLMQNTAPQLPPGALPAPSVPGANSSMGGQSIPPLMSAGGPNTGPFPPQSFGGPSGFGPPPPQPPGIFGALQPAQQFDYSHGQGPVVMTEFGGMPPQSGPPVNIPPLPLPDLSKPPPGFPPPGFQQMGLPPPPPLMSLNIRPPHEVDLMPSMPYYDLPAGLMAPLVKLEDSDYKPLNPKDIRLPPPMPPTDRLLAAVELFYSPPSHERPRDSDGWEKLGLYEFFKAKQKARKLKDEKSRQRSRSRSRSPRRDRDGGRHRSRSRSPSSRRDRRRSRSRSRSSSRSRSKSRSRSRERSKTPPGFYAEPFYQKTIDTRLGQENKGHQLLTKMGWGGGGLGQLEQGMTDPVAHADVRDRQDMYKGIGISLNDPFENFRKNRSQGYVTRMREKAETASATTGGTSLSQDSGERD